MSILKGTEKVINPLQQSALNKKGLCDYVVNVASGCLHGCTFCYVPSTPVIRARQAQLQEKGVDNPQMDWGKYLFIREDVPEQLEAVLSRKRTWHETSPGRGVVLLCSGTDPYQNKQTATVSRAAIQTLLRHNKRVRVLTRGLLWTSDLDILANPNVTVGMSLPYGNDDLSCQIEPQAPPPSKRYQALLRGSKAGCRLYVAVAPTPPMMDKDDFKKHLDSLLLLNPEVIFWEPINARGTNGKRMLAAGLNFTKSIMEKDAWATCFLKQWEAIEAAAEDLGCIDRLHIWPDQELKGYVDSSILDYWWYKPTVEKWDGIETVDRQDRKSPPRQTQLPLLNL
ncbi:MAG: radical SAM protein [Coleofasciculus sp. S288]|nr:radical SAM protein [Coleofasciculus sp. S288]